ncbi:phosphinothricin acetyltransferase [Xanthomonas arboricola]|uniref:N-acetyltransferase n=1 Tax=Xanthomonas euroxanthea TaxID=2259622 RepID=A0A8E4E7K5_9XANT|nr:GNAT family N-acetyltransferase [Xanthomonas euroxanthea]SYZ55052.1 N-acetyltransferase [Xanthomonas arboricola pv. juglandis]MBB3780882.1 phosphinothricin acetyltransferase [Xanthomonas euroxanthea]MBB3813416.1 phosphinothricin acetyltransferase [Xanthomonas euroxanthea]NIK10567.1 phosphinothricin acetyltransferase [Xanthomonas euroxanthea]CAD1796290.1 N-acetyltransferase [Xanthomonas euroxanthea]
MSLIDCSEDRHASAILDIFNDAIATSTALYDYRPRPPESMVGWFATKRAGGFPVIGVEAADGSLMGFASYGTFRAWPAFKYSVEHSVYVHRDHRGKGLGRLLLQGVIAAAEQRGVHVLVGGIDASNQASIALHEQFGFTHAGTVREAGFKFGRWLDLAFYQRILATPADPHDD